MTGALEGTGRERRHPLLAYVALVRLPNLFTAPPDVVLGAALVAGVGNTVSPTAVGGLAVSSVLLYAAGTSLNDYFDASEDAVARPERPIPSGEVSPPAALALGASLLVGAAAVAFYATGPTGGAVAGLLALVIVLYDGAFKGGVVGVLFMGAARGLNVLLGTTAGGNPLSLPPRALGVPAAIVLYIASVTYMAESETGGGDRGIVAVAIGGTVLAGVAALGFVSTGTPGVREAAVALALAAAFLAWTGRALRDAYVEPLPRTIGPAVGACILGLVVLDGAFAASVGLEWAAVAVAFFIPAVGLSRAFDVT